MILQININSKIYLISAKNILQTAINISRKLLIDKKKLYFRFIFSTCRKKVNYLATIEFVANSYTSKSTNLLLFFAIRNYLL